MAKSLDAADIVVVRPAAGAVRPMHDTSRGPLDDNNSNDSGGWDSFTTHVDDKD
ncbi:MULTISPECIES: hypothetical protein [Kitasatospora]|uniref:DUF397 domain-containing protein n=1 Tax=Kitasatospora cystarginea TaxID=58350 RepID=A0ABN3ESR9_9ACTN